MALKLTENVTKVDFMVSYTRGEIKKVVKSGAFLRVQENGVVSIKCEVDSGSSLWGDGTYRAYSKDAFINTTGHEKKIVRCVECGHNHRVENMVQVSFNKWVCKDCLDKLYALCDDCFRWEYKGDLVETSNGRHVCGECNRSNYFECEHCGRLYPNSEMEADTHVCSECFSDNYVRCSDCGEPISNSMATPLPNGDIICGSCAYRRARECIRSYSYKPNPRFYSRDGERTQLYFGFELEVDNGNESHKCRNAKEVQDNIAEVYCKSDGSLNDGYEIVSHPMTPAYILHDFKIDELCSIPRKENFTSHDAGTCGLHVHVSRDGLGDTQDERNTTIVKICHLFTKFYNREIMQFSRRNGAEANRWANNPRVILDTNCNIDDINYIVRRVRNDTRYLAVNLQNDNTIEFRIFRGTLNPKTFRATIQFCENIANYCIDASISDVINASFDDIVNYSYFAELSEYWQERKTKAVSSCDDDDDDDEY